ncbi:hypothetical protein H4R99_005670, partial [Coemansia sp. RSA 1722]
SFSFGGAAKSIFGSDDRQLQSLLHLLSAESPMLGISGSNGRSEALHAEAEALDNVKADGERGAGVLDSAKDESGPDKGGNKIQEGNDGKLESKPEERPGSGTTNAELDIKPEQRQGSDAKADSEITCSDEFKQAVAGSGKETGAATPKVATSVTSLGVDAHKLAEAISSTLALSTGLNSDMDCDDDMELDLDMSMVFPGSDNDVDMICCSTPPSPPPPPSLPVRQRRISNAPLTIPRTLSPAMSARSMDGASTSGCEDALDDLDPLDGSRSHIHSRAQSPQGQEQQQQPSHEHQRQQSQQQQQQQRSPHSGGSFNARLAQTMEAFGFTGAAKTSLLLRLRAAAAAKSTGRQQAVAPYMLYRNSNSSVANSGSAGGSIKRGKTLACIDEDESLSAGGSGVRKRARVVRIPRVKPLAKSKAKARSAPDASVVMRLASAIYNHTLNMATLAQAQRQTAAAPGDGSTAGTSAAPVPAPALASAQALASATTKATTPTSVTSASKSASAALAASPRAHNPVARSTGGSSPSAVRPPQQQRYNSPVYHQQHQHQQQQQQQRVSSPIGQRVPVRPGIAPSTPNQNGQPLLNRPGTTPTRPPIRRPVMRPGVAGSGASSPGNMGSPSPRLMQQQRPMMVRRPPPNGAPHTPPSGGPVRSGQSGRPPTPGSAGQHVRPFPRPAGAAPGSGSPGTPLRRPPPPSAQQGMGIRPGAPSPRPIPGRPHASANGIVVQRPRPPMLNGARPRPAMARQPPLAHQGGGANVRPGSSAGIIARPQQQVCSAQGPVTPVTPTSSSSTAGQQAGAVRPRPQPLQKPHPQLHQPPLQSPPKSHPQLPKTPVSATLASSRLAGAASPSAPSTPTAVAAAPTAPSPVANKNAD